MKLHEAFSPEESKKIYDNFLAIVNDSKRRDRLVRTHGKNAENVAYGTAVNQVKKQAANNVEQPTTEDPLEPEVRLNPEVPSAPEVPDVPELPLEPDVLLDPLVPFTPEVPIVPEDPELPLVALSAL